MATVCWMLKMSVETWSTWCSASLPSALSCSSWNCWAARAGGREDSRSRGRAGVLGTVHQEAAQPLLRLLQLLLLLQVNKQEPRSAAKELLPGRLAE